MLTAFHVPSNSLVQATWESSFRELASKSNDFICPYCTDKIHTEEIDKSHPVFPRFREGYAAHFVCKNKDCPYYLKHGANFDLRLHSEGCHYLKEMMKQKEQTELTPMIDYPLDLSGGFKSKRIADVYLLLPDRPLIYEFQKSAITIESLHERTSDYHRIGAEVQWFFNGAADIESNHQWCEENLITYFSVKAEKSVSEVAVGL